MKGLLYSEDQDFYIDGRKLSGISSINGEYSVPTAENSFLGNVGPIGLIQNAPGRASFSFSKSMITNDQPITDLFVETGFNGGLAYNGKQLGFNSGFLTSYRVSFGIGGIPKTSASISVYGDMGGGVVPESTRPQETGIFIPSSSGIIVDCDGRQTNRVTSFSYGVDINRTPIYKVGSIFPCEVMTSSPIRNSFSINLEVDDYSTKNIYDYIKTGIHNKNFKIQVEDRCDNSKKTTYLISGAHLVSEKFSADSDNNTSVSLSYESVSLEPPSIIYS